MIILLKWCKIIMKLKNYNHNMYTYIVSELKSIILKKVLLTSLNSFHVFMERGWCLKSYTAIFDWLSNQKQAFLFKSDYDLY